MRLPLLVSVPHAGLDVPPEAAPLCRLTPEEIAADGDGGAAAIYAFADAVTRFETSAVARAIVDLNRAADDFRKDGVIKTHTCWDVPVWREPPDAALVATLLARHHAPYHARLARPDDAVRLGVDCHTMAAFGPPVGPDPGSERPEVCLSDADGTLPRDWFERLAAAFRATFEGEVALNRPFRGGHIVRAHAAERPWVQVELSRAPFDSDEGKRRRVLAALGTFCRALF